MSAERLIAMANDIARNLAGEPDPDARLAEHLKKFWAPRMRAQLADQLAQTPEAADPLVRAALARAPNGD
jgi:formate dehydrogenase subunit delta